MIEEHTDTPEEELKRADHLVFVSLKYTRTCDIMGNAIKRMIAAFELSIDEYLEILRKKKGWTELPKNYKEKVAMLKPEMGNATNKYITLYNLLKRIDKSKYKASEEFRKNVTMTLTEGKSLSVKVEDLYNYLKTTKEFVSFIKSKN